MVKRKLHEFINNIEHKHCRSCKKWKVLDLFGFSEKPWDKLYYSCQDCRKKKDKQRLENRKKAREDAPIGFSVCLERSCSIKDPKQWLQPVNQFNAASVHRHTLTTICLTCRTRKKASANRPGTNKAACQKLWDEWRMTNPCLECSKDPKYKHNYLVIEADHLPEFEKVKACSALEYWGTKLRGPLKLRKELKKVQPLCCFHHKLQTQQRNHDKKQILRTLRRRAIINAEKHKRGCCLTCKRIVKEGEECGFSFDHRDPTTKFKRNGKAINPSYFVYLPQALFDSQWPLEQAKCDLLCANCDKLKTFGNRDGYRK